LKRQTPNKTEPVPHPEVVPVLINSAVMRQYEFGVTTIIENKLEDHIIIIESLSEFEAMNTLPEYMNEIYTDIKWFFNGHFRIIVTGIPLGEL